MASTLGFVQPSGKSGCCPPHVGVAPPTVVKTLVKPNVLPPSIPRYIDIAGAVTCDGGACVTQVGFCWSYSEAPPASVTTSTVQYAAYLSPPGFTLRHYNERSGGDVTYGRLFALNAAGLVGYSDTFSFATPYCFAEGTQIAVWSGGVTGPGTITSKAVQDVWYTDELVVWDFTAGRLGRARPAWIKIPEVAAAVSHAKFANGAHLSIVGHHCVFNVDVGAFTSLFEDTAVGATTVALDATSPTGVSRTTVTGLQSSDASSSAVTIGAANTDTVTAGQTRVWYYNVITETHWNLFANGVLVSCEDNNVHGIDADSMKFCVGVPSPFATEDTAEQVQVTLATRAALRATSVLFLDHTGVMRVSWGVCRDFDAAAVHALNELLVADPTLDIVVCSDWQRHMTLAHLQDLYKENGVVRVPIGVTSKTGIAADACYDADKRARDILQWLQDPAHGNVARWAVADDLPIGTTAIMSGHACAAAHCVQVRPSIGLCGCIDKVRAALAVPWIPVSQQLDDRMQTQTTPS